MRVRGTNCHRFKKPAGVTLCGKPTSFLDGVGVNREASRIAVVKCADYEPARVRIAMDEALNLLGSKEWKIARDERVLVKINNINNLPPERVATTHPSVVEALLRKILEAGAVPVVCDDVLVGYGHRVPFEGSGIKEVCRRLGVGLVNLRDAGYEEVRVQEGLAHDSYRIARPFLEADALINVAKLKTHNFTLYTGAIKNLFGLVPHRFRVACHGAFRKREDFDKVLIDILAIAAPKLRLSVMDGVVAMEGDGPTGGSPRDVGYIMAGEDPVALDTLASHTIGFDPLQIAVIRTAGEKGYGRSRLDEIEVVGVRPSPMEDFHLPMGARFTSDRMLRQLLHRYITKRPRVLEDVCTACGVCTSNCPTGAITVDGGPAVIDEKRCIGCFCCQEFCSFSAVLTEGRFMGSRALYQGLRWARRRLLR